MPRRASPPMAATMAVGVARIRAHGTGHDQHGDGAQPVAREVEGQRRRPAAAPAGSTWRSDRPGARRGRASPWPLPPVGRRAPAWSPTPARVTRMRSRPLPFSVPEKTSSPGCLSRGSGSPVMELSSMVETPCSMTPSAAMRSPARTTMRSSGHQRRRRPLLLPRRRAARARGAASAATKRWMAASVRPAA